MLDTPIEELVSKKAKTSHKSASKRRRAQIESATTE